MKLERVELIYIHFDTDCHCGPTEYPAWHMEFTQAMCKRTSDGPNAQPPWGGAPINPLFASVVLSGIHDGPLSQAIAAGNMGEPVVQHAWPGFREWWAQFWQRQAEELPG